MQALRNIHRKYHTSDFEQCPQSVDKRGSEASMGQVQINLIFLQFSENPKFARKKKNLNFLKMFLRLLQKGEAKSAVAETWHIKCRTKMPVKVMACILRIFLKMSFEGRKQEERGTRKRRGRQET